MKISPWLVHAFTLDLLFLDKGACVCSIVDKIVFVLHGGLMLLYCLGAKLGEQSQTGAAAMRPNALVRVLRAVGFELFAEGPTSYFRYFCLEF